MGEDRIFQLSFRHDHAADPADSIGLRRHAVPGIIPVGRILIRIIQPGSADVPGKFEVFPVQHGEIGIIDGKITHLKQMIFIHLIFSAIVNSGKIVHPRQCHIFHVMHTHHAFTRPESGLFAHHVVEAEKHTVHPPAGSRFDACLKHTAGGPCGITVGNTDIIRCGITVFRSHGVANHNAVVKIQLRTVSVRRPASAGSTEQHIPAADTDTDTAAATHHRGCFKVTVKIEFAGFTACKVAHHGTVHHADRTIVRFSIADAQTAAGNTRIVVHHGDFFHTEVGSVIARSGEMSIFKPDLCVNGTAGNIGSVAVEKQILEYQIHGGEDTAARN